MNLELENATPPLCLGIEGGATHTVGLLADARDRLVSRAETGPANVKLLTDAQLQALLRSLAGQFRTPDALGIGLAGARTEADRDRIRRAAAQVWPGTPCHAANDLESALAAASARSRRIPDSPPRRPARVQVLVLSGTGSCCYGRREDGATARVGGWGHLLGDRGSGYELGLAALRASIRRYDDTGRWSGLGQRILQTLLLNDPEALIGWVQDADKAAVAGLAPVVFAAAAACDEDARGLIRSAGEVLWRDAVACAAKLARPGAPAQFVLAGSVLLKQPRFARTVTAAIRRAWPGASVAPLRREGAWGAVKLARSLLEGADRRPPELRGRSSEPEKRGSRAPSGLRSRPRFPELPALASLGQSPTEQRNPRSARLDRLTLSGAIELMLSESARILPALRAEQGKIEIAIRWIIRALKGGGRLFYVGAGTSGRLGVLDASECPPTFRVPPDQVQGIVAGGQTALWQSVEGAEDDAEAGSRAIGFRGVRRGDVVVGIAASGRTPFVWGALDEARRRKARGILLCFNPHLELPRRTRPHLVIAPNIGPEVLTGSTRLNAGTATKVVLNLFTTLSMVRLGKVVSNLMVDLNPSNLKLRDRAVRIVRELTGVSQQAAREALEASDWVVKSALDRLRKRGRGARREAGSAGRRR